MRRETAQDVSIAAGVFLAATLVSVVGLVALHQSLWRYVGGGLFGLVMLTAFVVRQVQARKRRP